MKQATTPSMSRMHRRTCHARALGEGMVLIAVLVIMMLAAMLAAGLLHQMRAEQAISQTRQDGDQAYYAAQAGLRTALRVMESSQGQFAAWHDAPELFQDREVMRSGEVSWRFTIWSMDAEGSASNLLDGDGEVGDTQTQVMRYGLSDEAGKVNVNTASLEMLARLPGVSADMAAAIIDYRDADSVTTQGLGQGAEQDYYDGLAEPYVIRNDELTSMDELLLIRGIGPMLLYGEDANWNHRLDIAENDGVESWPMDDGDGRLRSGLHPWVTVYASRSRQSNDEAEQESLTARKVDINGDLQALTETGIAEATLRYIRLYRAEGQWFGDPGELLEASYTLTKDHADGKAGERIESRVSASELEQVMERLTVRRREATPDRELIAGESGRVNVLTASATVLATIPGLDRTQAEQIVSLRQGLDESGARTTAWLFTKNVVDAQTFRSMSRYVGTESGPFSFRVAGYRWPWGRYVVWEVVAAMEEGQAKLVYVRDLSRGGWMGAAAQGTE